MEVPIELIRASPYQPRLIFDLKDIQEGVVRALKGGYLPNLVVREINNYYELIDGERRWRIAKQEEFKTVPCQILDVDDKTARGMVYKVNKERKSYSAEEEARFFKRLVEEERMKPYQIETELDVKHSWVQACLNVWKLPEDVRDVIFAPRGKVPYKIYLSDVRDLEGVINRNVGEAITILREIINKRATADEKREIITRREKKIEEERIKAIEKILPEVRPKLETPEEYEKTAKALIKRAEELKTPEQKAEEKRRKLIAQARSSLNATIKKINGAEKIIDVTGFRKRLVELEKSLEQNPADVKKQLIALGKEATEAKKQRQRELEEEKRKKREEEERRHLEEEMQRKLEEEKHRIEEESKKKAKEELSSDIEFLKQAAKKVPFILAEEKIEEMQVELPSQFTGEFSPRRPLDEKTNKLNNLNGSEWIKFTKTWFIHNPPPRKHGEMLHPAKFPETMIKEFIEFFTKPGQVVLDPLLGTGSTLVACDMTGRLGIGLELEERWAKIAKTRTKQNVILGDAIDIDKMKIPQVDFVITSPPYWNQLKRASMRQKERSDLGIPTEYSEDKRNIGNIDDYATFIEEQKQIFEKVYDLLKPGGYLVIITNNVFFEGKLYPLAFDTAISLSRNGRWVLKDEKVWLQDNKELLPLGIYNAWVGNRCHEYCLIFRKES